MKKAPYMALLAPLLILYLIFPCTAFSAPTIEAHPSAHDFGQLKEGHPAATSFEVRNVGDADLHISNVRTSCGCTGAVVGKRVVPPGDKTQVEVTYQTEGRPGPFHKSVSIESDDPAYPNLLIEIRGEVIARPAPALALSRGRVTIPPGPAGSLASFSISLANRGQEPLEVRRVVSRDGQMVLWADNLIVPPGQTEELPLKLVRPTDHFQPTAFQIESNDPRRPKYFFMVQEQEGQ